MFKWFRKNSKMQKEDTLELLKAIGIPYIVQEIFMETKFSTTNVLSQYYRCPTELYNMKRRDQEACFMSTFIPFLSDNSFYKIYAYDKQQKAFLTYFVEDAEEGWNEDAPRFTWDGIFVSEILFWWECEIPNKEILEMGKMLDLKYVEEILWSIENELEYTKPRDVNSWERKVIAQYKLKK